MRASVAAGTIRSTMVPGKLTCASIHAASSAERFPAIAENGIFHHVAVVGNIVAGEHGKRRQAPLAAAMKRFNQNTRRGMRLRRVLEIVQDAAVPHIQFSRRRIDAVAFFR
ncbi:hypothetical protein HR12_05330 [Microbacterium sp. SUBG005]|nr:hypothetical protein HR12_05330 [Microbacterium sp. SUBG005]